MFDLTQYSYLIFNLCELSCNGGTPLHGGRTGLEVPIHAHGYYVASIFVPSVLELSFLTFSTWSILCLLEVGPSSFIPTHDRKFISVFNFDIPTLGVACPCALKLATPMAVLVKMGIGAEHGKVASLRKLRRH